MDKTRKVYGLILFSFLALTALIVIVSAATFLEDLNSALQGTLSESAKQTLSKVLLMALLAMLIYGISSFLPFIDSEGIKWGIAIVVSILAFLFVTPGDIQAILTSYEALGVALTSIFPLIVIIFFSLEFESKILEKGPDRAAYGKLLDTLIFITFGIYLFYRIVSPLPGTSGLRYIYIISLLILLVWAIQVKKITLRFIETEKGKAEAKGAAKTSEAAVRRERALARAHKAAAKPINPLRPGAEEEQLG